MLLEYPLGVAAPIHNHPVSATGYVLQGEVASLWEGGGPDTYRAADSFIDHGARVHLRSDNTSTTEPLRLLTSYVIRVGQPIYDPPAAGARR